MMKLFCIFIIRKKDIEDLKNKNDELINFLINKGEKSLMN